MAAAAIATACSSNKNSTASEFTAMEPARTGATIQASQMPKAVIYKTSEPCAEFVPVQFDEAGNLVSFPAPTDITDQSTPLPLADGFLLDRRGVSPYSRFTTWTWREYRALAQAPAPAEIKSHLLPDARVTEVQILPMTLNEALADTAAVNKLIVSEYNKAKATSSDTAERQTD